MKNLRKVLSLILVVAMACSFMMFASAKDYEEFTDAADISDKYLEAVDVISALNIFIGDETGKLDPQGTFTRAQASKIVAYMSIGNKAAESLTATGGIFADVPSTHWASKYIAFAANAGILNGDGDGNFRPEDSVTGAEVSKLMNTVLGYGKKGEYVGASWQINAISDGISRGLIVNVDDLTAPALREEVIQAVFNTIRPDGANRNIQNFYVEYSSIIGAYVEAAGSTWAVGNVNKTNIGEFIFGLIAIGDDDASGRPTHYWKAGPTIITGEYNSRKAAIISTGGSRIFTNDVNSRNLDLESANKLVFAPILTTAPTPVTITYNGSYDWIVGGTDSAVALDAAGAVGTDSYNVTAAKLGVITEIYVNENTGFVDLIVIIEKAAAQALASPTFTFGAISAIAGLFTNPGDTFAGDLDIVKDDIVLYYTDRENVVHVEKAKSIEGQLTYFKDNTFVPTLVTVTFGGENHRISQLDDILIDIRLIGGVRGGGAGSDLLTNKAHYNVDSTIWVDDSNSLIWFTPGKGAENYVYVYDFGMDAFSQPTIAKLVGTDGSFFTVNVKAASGQTLQVPAGGANTIEEGALCSFSKGDDGVYTLKREDPGKDVVTPGTPAPDNLINRPVFYNGEIGNSNTVFIILDGNFTTTWTPKVITGVGNLPSATPFAMAVGDRYALVNDRANFAKYVFIEAAATVAGASNVIYFPNPSLIAGGGAWSGTDYYLYEGVVVNGVLLAPGETVKVEATSFGVFNGGGLYDVALNGDIYTIVGPVAKRAYGSELNSSPTVITGTAPAFSAVLASGVKVYFHNAFNQMEVADYSKIITMNAQALALGNTQYYNYWYVEDVGTGFITELYIQANAKSAAALADDLLISAEATAINTALLALATPSTRTVAEINTATTTNDIPAMVTFGGAADNTVAFEAAVAEYMATLVAGGAFTYKINYTAPVATGTGISISVTATVDTATVGTTAVTTAALVITGIDVTVTP